MVLLLIVPQISMAALINNMQGCQGLIEHLDKKLAATSSKYGKSEVAKARSGLAGYNRYIQGEIITPGLLKFNAGDKAKAEAMQEQVDAYKQTVVNQYDQAYPQNRLFMDHAVALNECTKQAVPSGQALADLKETMTLMLAFARSN